MKRKEITVIAQAIMIFLLITACTPTVGIPTEQKATETVQPQLTPLPPFMEESINPGNMQAYSFLSSTGKEIDYVLYLPIEYYEKPTWPIIIYLHGDRMPMNNADDVLLRNPRNIFAQDSEFPFIFVAPVSPTANWKLYYEPINELLDTMAESLSIDLKAIILLGDSAGAYGAWHYALSNPDKFVAFAPVAGGPGGDPVPENICLLKDLPIWIFHSEADFTMRINSSYAALEALENCGNNSIRMTTYTDLNHVESIYSAYANPDLYEWMLEQVK